MRLIEWYKNRYLRPGRFKIVMRDGDFTSIRHADCTSKYQAELLAEHFQVEYCVDWDEETKKATRNRHNIKIIRIERASI